jgi:hypothetical protein
MDISDPVWGEVLHQKLQKAAKAGFVSLENDAPDCLHGTMGVRARLRPGQVFQGLDYDEARDRLFVLYAEQVFTTTLENFALLAEDGTASRAENNFHQHFIENCRETLMARVSVRLPQMALDPIK